MASQADVKEIDDEGKPQPKRRFDARDWEYIAEYVIEEYERRKNDPRRVALEKCWKDIDRQIAMEPEIAYKKLPNGEIDRKKAWMAETELPLQAQALEVLKADARRLTFPSNGAFFRAHAHVTDEYLQEVDFKSIIAGDDNDVPSAINQDNADKLVEGYLLDLFRQVDFESRIDRINSESFKYGMGVGRGRMEAKTLYIHESRGTRKETQRIPVLVPVSIKNTYLDDPMPSMHSAQQLGQAHIMRDWMKLENIQLAASKGTTDPDDEDGGWMPANLKKLKADDKGYVTVLEMEGDIVVPRKTTRSVVIPGAIVTVVLGGNDEGGNSTKAVIRFRFRKTQFSSYLLFPYHYESVDDAYPTGPLMKGRPVQMLATDAINRMLDSAMLKNAPPVGYDRTDMVFAQNGGPEIYPYAQWGTTDKVTVYNEVGGDPSALAGIFAKAVEFYAELTGVLPGRLGAQTNSHTTAFAKDAEMQRGAARTVSYVDQCGKGPMLRWLDMAYQMGRDSIKANETVSFFIEAYGGFVEVNKAQLPENVEFEWKGAAGPQDEQQIMTLRVNSLQLALKMDQMAQAQGEPPTVSIPDAIKEVLREGKWTDVDTIVKGAGQAVPSLGPGPTVAAIQNIAAQPLQ